MKNRITLELKTNKELEQTCLEKEYRFEALKDIKGQIYITMQALHFMGLKDNIITQSEGKRGYTLKIILPLSPYYQSSYVESYKLMELFCTQADWQACFNTTSEIID